MCVAFKQNILDSCVYDALLANICL